MCRGSCWSWGLPEAWTCTGAGLQVGGWLRHWANRIWRCFGLCDAAGVLLWGVCGVASEDLGENIGIAVSLLGGMRGGGRRQGRRDVSTDVVARINELCRG